MTIPLDYTYTPEPPPTGDGAIVLHDAIRFVQTRDGKNDWLVDALNRRAIDGKEKYGDYLRVNNGRAALIDYLQEQLDAIMYATQAYMENPAWEIRELLWHSIDCAKKAHNLIEGATK